ncbi:MAG: Fic family protein [Ruminococcus sp.]|nr:Fic family protein [Ruminococcus sp.]
MSEALNAYSILFAYHSCKIENPDITYHDTREIFEHDRVISYTGSLRTLFEIRNAKDAHELFLTAFNGKRQLDEEFIKELQYCLTKNTYDTRRCQIGERSGEYKKHDYVTGRKETGALPEYVHKEMKRLLTELQNTEDTLKTGAYFHAKFESVHPFADGTGRLAMNYFFVSNNHPSVIIHEEDRTDYYDALESWDVEQDLTPLCDFLKQQTEKTWNRQLQRVEKRMAIYTYN